MSAHKNGIKACEYYYKMLTDKQVQSNSIKYYYTYLTSGYILIQNKSGYESLKSRGHELIKDDRTFILNAYLEILEKY